MTNDLSVRHLADQTVVLLATIYCWLSHPICTLRAIRRTRRIPVGGLPKSLNDKFYWRKIFDHDPRFTVASDKLKCKDFVSSICPDLEIPRTLWESNTAEDVPQTTFTQPVVFKANHSCGTNLFLTANEQPAETLAKIGGRWLRASHGLAHHEWGYFNIDRKVFIEQMIGRPSEGAEELKIYTFGRNIARLVHICGRLGKMRANVWIPDQQGYFQRSRIRAEVAPPDEKVNLPWDIQRGLSFAQTIGKHFDQMRVDLMWDGQKFWLNELTVYNQGGYYPGPEGNLRQGSTTNLWDIRNSTFFKRDTPGFWINLYKTSLERVIATSIEKPEKVQTI